MVTSGDGADRDSNRDKPKRQPGRWRDARHAQCGGDGHGDMTARKRREVVAHTRQQANIDEGDSMLAWDRAWKQPRRSCRKPRQRSVAYEAAEQDGQPETIQVEIIPGNPHHEEGGGYRRITQQVPNVSCVNEPPRGGVQPRAPAGIGRFEPALERRVPGICGHQRRGPVAGHQIQVSEPETDGGREREDRDGDDGRERRARRYCPSCARTPGTRQGGCTRQHNQIDEGEKLEGKQRELLGKLPDPQHRRVRSERISQNETLLS